MTTDLWSSKERAREVLRETILGLLLLLAVYIILRQINPEILNVNLSVAPTSALPAAEGVAPSTLTGPGSGYVNYTWTPVGTVPTGASTFRPQSCSEARGGGWVAVDGRFCGGAAPGTSYSCCGYDQNYRPPVSQPSITDESSFTSVDQIPAGAWCYGLQGSFYICNPDASSCAVSANDVAQDEPIVSNCRVY